MSERVADLLVEILQAAGARTCYRIVDDTPGRRSQPGHRAAAS
jgi:hypothetical protein